MKLLLENWNNFLTEENEKEFLLLLEQELNEATLQQAKDWFLKKLKGGSSEEKEKARIKNATAKDSDSSRRDFLRGALGAAVVGAMATPGTALGAPERTEMADINIMDIINHIITSIPESYSSSGKAGQRFISLMDRGFAAAGQKEDIGAIKKFYENRIYGPFLDALASKEFKISEKGKPRYREMQEGQMAFVRAQVYLTKKGKEAMKPVDLFLNSALDWDNEENFQEQTGDTRYAAISHELEHAIEYSIHYVTSGQIHLSKEALEELEKIFELPSELVQHADRRGAEDIDFERWERALDELYAEFKSLRTRLGGTIKMTNLEKLCDEKRMLTGYGVHPKISDFTIHPAFLRMLRCPPNEGAGQRDK